MKEKFYITTSIAYTNAKPHIGFALELLQADVLTRYKRKEGFDVYFLTGTDEHGSKIARAAKENSQSPQDFVDEVAESFQELIKKLSISNNDFIRTTDKERHWPGVELLWEKIKEAGDIYKKSYTGLYCSGCEAFKKEKELVEGKCPDHDRKPEMIEEENYFFRLSKYKEKIKELIEKEEVKITPESRKKEITNFLKKGLEDISVSRSAKNLSWGIPVPGDKSQVLYVWLDALTNYISALGYGGKEEEFGKYWPADVHCVGKDILRFHSIIWIGMLLSARIETPKEILVHGHITSEGKKMSKSLGNVVDPFLLIEEYKTDPVRYFLLKEIPTTGDGDFSYKRLAERCNSDLSDGIGNLLARTIALAKKKNVDLPQDPGERIKEELEKAQKRYRECMENYQLSEALDIAWEIVHFTDGYIEEQKPWEEKEESKKAIEDLLFILFFLSDILEPFIPQSTLEIRSCLEEKKKKVLFPKIK